MVTTPPCVGLADDEVYDPKRKRTRVAGDQFVDVFEQRDANHYQILGRLRGSFRAKTAILVPN